MGPVIAELAAGRTLAPLMIGVTGKLDLDHRDDGVKAALEAAFDRIDARCPNTPKVLLSALARGADTVAAQTALARGWNVVAPLPFDVALYAEDFDGAAKAEFEALLAHPRVRAVALDPMRREDGGAPYAPDELSRLTGPDVAARTEHYEQVGLYIAERSAILMAVMKIGEEPGKTGGTARIVHHRLHGELDATEAAIRRRSDMLTEPARLDDRHAGPVWVVDLGRLKSAPKAPADALRIRIPGHAEPADFDAPRELKDSFLLADGLEALNRRILAVDEADWAALEKRAGRHTGDAGVHVQRVRLALSAVQSDLTHRVRQSIWFFGALFVVAILSFELSAGPLSSPWAALGYPVLVLVGVGYYRWASRGRWQRLAEDYRAASEALRVQRVWWQSGLTGREDRVGRYYLRGARGAPRQLRIFIDHLIDAAQVCFRPPAVEEGAVTAWADSQVEFFDKRVEPRRRWLSLVQGGSWFLVAVSVVEAICLAALRIPGVETVLSRAAGLGWPLRAAVLGAAIATFAGVATGVIHSRLAEARQGAENPALSYPTPADWIGGAVAGLALATLLCDAATLIGLEGAHEPARVAREMVAIFVIVPAAIAGSIRYVAEKLSWEAELSGYEHACERFRRGLDALTAARAQGAEASEEYRQVVRAMGVEALAENENWLRAHRERPLEPLVGG